MFLKNLLRRKTRTLLTVVGIAIGVAAIVALGAMADGLETGYTSMLTGTKADLVLSQPDAADISYSSVDENIGAALASAPEVSEVSGMLEGFASAEDQPFFFVFGYPEDSFVLERFKIISGTGLYSREAQHSHGKPILLGSGAAEVLKKEVGDTIRLTGSAYRIIGIYETGDAFEDTGAVLRLSDAQELVGKPRQVSLFYIRLKDPDLSQRLITRIERQYKNLSISGMQEYTQNQAFVDILQGYVWAIGGLAIVIGGVGMMNAQLMAVMERTREIGVLRAIGWSKRRVLWMILSESIVVCLIGGVLGVGLGWLLLYGLSEATLFMGMNTTTIKGDLLLQAFYVVSILGLVGGLYPAWRASRLQPVEALRYEGGSSGAKVRRLPVGGMAMQSLWQRSARTLLTLGAIGLTVGAIMALETMIKGFLVSFNDMLLGTDTEIMLRQANISDTEFSAIDERVGEKIAAMPEVKSISGIIFTAVLTPDYGGFFILFGYAPNEFAIQRFNVVEGKAVTSNHQIMLGRTMAETMNRGVGDSVNLSGTRFRVVGIYESQASWEELGGVISMRDAQIFSGRPRKVGMYAVKLRDPKQGEATVAKINREFPDVHASLTGEFTSQMPDMKTMDGMINGITFLSILVGGVGVLNTMLMAVFERTREIGVLRSLGWQRHAILGMILREALLLGLLGGIAGIFLSFGLVHAISAIPMIGSMLQPVWELEIFARAIFIALLLGTLGGLYPAYRATRLQPVEALRYE